MSEPLTETSGSYYAGKDPPSKGQRYFRYTLAALFFIFVFITVTLSLGHAISKSRPAFFIIGAALLIIAVVTAMQLNWMRLDKYDSLPRAKYSIIALCLAVMAVSSAVLAIVYEAPNTVYSVGGTAQNVQSSFMLINNGDHETLSVTAGPCNAFTFPTKLASGSSYDVQVQSQPGSGTCTVQGGKGTVSNDVTSIRIVCTVTYAVGGRVNGLNPGADPPLALGLNGDNRGQNVEAAGSFVFDTRLNDGASWTAAVVTQPRGQTCSFSGASSGTIQGADVTTLQVNCQ